MRHGLGFRKIIGVITAIICVAMSVPPAAFAEMAENTVLAFPGAEGGGKFSPGARGELENGGTIEVYHVTSLENSGDGTLRDAVSKSGRIIVFDVSGTIEISGNINISRDNITILGQTAPGDGVTISGGALVTDDNAKNIIIRYLKVRPTDKNGGEPDGIGGRFGSNIIFDHISTSWCVDELLTLYGGPAQDLPADKQVGNRLTIQNTIGSESLRMSNHQKGAHGYGAIWGGTYASYINNLLAHHDSRSPRLDRQLVATDVSNNVIYDWGQTNSAYGAEPYASGKSADGSLMKNASNVNWVGNYYKSGPSTRRKLATRVFDVTGPEQSGDPKSVFYFNNNIIEGLGEVQDYKNNDIVNNYQGADFSETEIDMGDYKYEQKPADEAYEYILNNVGATLPRRDAQDARIINDVINGTGRVINNAGEVGGLIPAESETRRFEVPAEWLAEKGYSGKVETDITESGYTVIEEYINEWTEEQSKTPPTNPDIVVESPAIASLSDTVQGISVQNKEWTVITEGEPLKYKAAALAKGGNAVTKMELYDRNTKLDEFQGSDIDCDITGLEPGAHYLTCRATNTRGEKTQSTTSIVYVKPAAAPGRYSFAEIRESGYTGYAGKGGASMDSDGVYTISGSGRLTTDSTDSCAFMYREVTGDFDITVRVEEIPKFENQQVSGLMVRSGLEPGDTMAMIGDGWVKNGENVRVLTRKTDKSAAQEVYFKTKSGEQCDNSDDKHSFSMPKYMRIVRQGGSLTFSVSNMGDDWTDNDRQPFTIEYDNLPDKLLVGLATDSANGVSTKEYFSMAKFSRLTLNGESDAEPQGEGAVPFYDEEFTNPNWYFPTGSGGKSLADNPLGGNIGEAALFWNDTYRVFDPQCFGVVKATADFYTTNNAQVNQKAGARFMLQGTDSAGSIVKIKSIYAQHELGFFEDYDEADPLAPGLTPASDAKYELEKWYKVVATLDYNSGKGTYAFMPYTVYNSSDGVYQTGAPIFECEFDFDTSIALSRLHFERRGGYEMYLDNVGVTYDNPLLSAENGKITVDNPSKAATLYVAAYDSEGALTVLDTRDISAGETVSFDVSEFNVSGGDKACAYLWDENYAPLWYKIDVR